MTIRKMIARLCQGHKGRLSVDRKVCLDPSFWLARGSFDAETTWSVVMPQRMRSRARSMLY